MKTFAKLLLTGGAAALFAGSAQAVTPDLSGYWMPDHPVRKITTIEGKGPPLKRDMLAVYQKNTAAKAMGDLSFDPTAKCVSAGIPRMLYMPYPFEIVQSQRRIVMLFAWNRISRLIELAQKAQPADYPYKMGMADGGWQGNELVVHTRDIADDTLLDDSGLPHSDAMKITERYSLSADGRALTNLITVDDPKAFSRSWQTKVTYRRMPADYIIHEDICLDRTDAGHPAVDEHAHF